MSHSLKHQFLSAIDGCFIISADKHSIKREMQKNNQGKEKSSKSLIAIVPTNPINSACNTKIRIGAFAAIIRIPNGIYRTISIRIIMNIIKFFYYFFGAG